LNRLARRVHLYPLTAAGEERFAAGGVGRGAGACESGSAGRTGVRLCNLVAQSEGDAEGEL
jgi:hypothetical protein